VRGVVAWAAVAALAKPVGAAAAAVVAAAFLGPPLLLRARRRTRVAAAAALAVAVALVAAYTALSADRRSGAATAASYFRDFYTPSTHAGVWDVWLRSGIGRFGWQSVSLPAWAFALALASLVAAPALVALAPRARRLDGGARCAVASCALAAVAYVLLLNAVEAYTLAHPHSGTLLQGRYLTAVAPLAVAGLLTAATRLPPRLAHALCAALVAVWLLVSLVALDTVVRYFAA
jgi:hypothetical protein